MPAKILDTHTKLPWSVGKRRPEDNTIEINYPGKKGGRVVALVCPQPFFGDNQEANAAYIVEACNNYERLKEQVAVLTSRLEQSLGDPFGPSTI